MATRTISVLGGNWSALTAWVEGAVPLASDDVVATALSGSLTVDTASVCRSLDLIGYTATFTISADLNIGDGTAGTGNVALRLPASGFTFAYTTGTLSLVSTSGTQQTVFVGGSYAFPLTLNGTGGSWILTHLLNIGSNNITLSKGAIDSGNYDITCNGLVFSSGNTKSLTLGTSNVTFTGSVAITASSVGTTLSASSSTINLTYTGASTSNLQLIGKTWGTINISSGGSGIVSVTGGGTVASLNRSGVGTKTVRVTAGTTITTGVFFNGTAGNLWTINSFTAASSFTLAKLGGGNFNDGLIDYISLKDCTGPAGTNYAGANSTLVSGNTNWVATAPPAASATYSTNLMMGI